jgi:hypothetical protein
MGKMEDRARRIELFALAVGGLVLVILFAIAQFR